MRKIIKILVLCIAAATLCGCGSESGQASQITLKAGQIGIYYVDSKSQGLVQEAYTPQEKDTALLIQELFGQLRQQPREFSYRSAIPEDVSLLDSKIDGKQLTLHLGESYYSMDSISEVLCRAAIVRTLLQIDGIDGIEFMVGNQSMLDKSGRTVGVMTEDTFVDVNGFDSNSYQETELKLYFSNTSGNGLVLVQRKLLYSTNVSMEKLVVEQLLRGIDSEDTNDLARPVLPSDTKLLNLYTKDGVCYVNFDGKFANQTTNVSEEVIIYSLVNSLTELPGISKVQISINGESNRMYKEKINLNTMFERNTSYMAE